MSDLSYFQRRHADELAAAERASTPEAGQAHRDLADRYATLIDEAVTDMTPTGLGAVES